MTDLSLDTTVDALVRRNGEFAAARDVPGRAMLPTGRPSIVGCVVPRVEPIAVLGLELGEAAVIRNIGGRITPAAQRTLALLGAIARTGGTQPGPGWNLVVIH